MARRRRRTIEEGRGGERCARGPWGGGSLMERGWSSRVARAPNLSPPMVAARGHRVISYARQSTNLHERTMPSIRAITVALLTSPSLASALAAQAPPRTASVADSSPFRALDLPAPNEYRTGSGRPGPRYWQQRVDYRIAATLDPARNELRGRETIHYVNNSPERLSYLWLFLEQNICAPTSLTNQLDQPPLVFLGSSFDFSCQGFQGGLTLDSVRAGRSGSAATAAKMTIYGTTMRLDLPAPLAAGLSIDVDLSWHFGVPAMGAGRMGHDGPLYEMAQWYPRLAVFDDVRGWNHEPYI